MRELVELESGYSDEADDGKDSDQAAAGAEAARKRVLLIAAVKSKLEEIDERLRMTTFGDQQRAAHPVLERNVTSGRQKE